MLLKFDFVVFALVVFVTPNVLSMTRQQIKSSGKILKKSCMPKNSVTEDQIGEIEQGKFLEEKNVKCYIACVYSMGGAIKNNKFAHDAMLKQVDMMFPPEMKEPVKTSIENCKVVATNQKMFIRCTVAVRITQLLHIICNRQTTIQYTVCSKPNCIKAKQHKDICDAAYWTAKCLYDNDPANFVFP